MRGFDGQQTLIGDHGWVVRNELIAPIANSKQALYWGVDYGEVGGQSTQTSLGNHLAGTVVGLRGGINKPFGQFNYDVFLGQPISKPKGFITQNTVAGFNFNYSY